ncbi:MAG TPA: 30S ribosomal protein THX [Candidatus Hydrogenedentes bacterium]|nr:30S ribosomal protein THX [Candidatus Hydrogenedentota bacterium]HPG68661.1 30S ribosomal protein THX [Candidatus Hydrogenedentota bacterium]
MGKGDRRTGQGKRYRGSFGNTRRRKPKKKPAEGAAVVSRRRA